MQSWERTYWVVFGANLVTAVGMMSFLPFFPTFLEELGVHDRAELATWTGLVFGAAPLAAAVMGPVWGSLGDRFGRKVMVLRALLAISLFVGAMSFVRTPLQLFVLRLGQGVFSGFIPPSITLVSIAAPRERQGRVAGTLQASLAVGSIAGPLAGEFLQQAFGIRSVFLFVALASGSAALGIALFAHEDPSLRETRAGWSPSSLFQDILRDLRELFANPRVRAALLLLFLVQLSVGATSPLLELHVRDLFAARGPPAADSTPAAAVRLSMLTAWLFTSLALATLVATPWWGRYGDRVGHGKSLGRAAGTAAVALLLHALAPTYAVLLAARVLLGFGASGANASAFATAAVETRAERRGSAIGSMFSARALAISLGSMSGGALASLFGINALFWGGGLALSFALIATRLAPGAGDAAEITRSDGG